MAVVRKWVPISAAIVVAAVGATFLVVRDHRIEPAAKAGNAKCAEVVSRAPEDIPGNSRDRVIGEGVASWGGKTAVLRCGVDELPPNANLCITADGVDWVLNEARLQSDGVSVLRTYGRSPAVEVTYSGPREDVGGVLASLVSTVEWIPQTRSCISLEDVQ